MKISNIKQSGNIFTVTFTPTKFESFFGKKEYEEEFKMDSQQKFMFGGRVYYRKNGEQLLNGDHIGQALDVHQKAW